MDYSGLSDEALVARLGRGDAEAFRALFERYVDLVYSVSVRIVAQRDLAEDVGQEVFLKLWRRPSLFDSSRGRFVTWLLAMTRNRSIDERRSRRRWFHEDLPRPYADEEGLPADDSNDPALAAVASLERAAIRRALGDLPPEQRAAIDLAYFGGLTHSEIAGSLGLPVGTVKTRIRLGMQKLRDALARRGEV